MGITTEESNDLMRDIEISNIKLLVDLDRITLAKVISTCERVHVKSGETIYRPGDPEDALYIITPATKHINPSHAAYTTA